MNESRLSRVVKKFAISTIFYIRALKIDEPFISEVQIIF